MGKRIVLATWGSLGDLHPFLALAVALQARGHRPVIATINAYREKVTQAGVGFAPVGPHIGPEDKKLARDFMNPVRGPGFLIRQVLYSYLRRSFYETVAAAEDADLLVTHPVTFGAHLAAEKLRMPWVSTVMAPMGFFSVYDATEVPGRPVTRYIRPLGPPAARLVSRIGRVVTGGWLEPVRAFRAEIGLPPGRDPVHEGQHSPALILALFSPLIGKPQPDWPPQTVLTGFPFLEPDTPLDPELERFLEAGPPPVVFTLGSAAVWDPGAFYHESAEAARRLGSRAILLIGDNGVPAPLPPGVIAVPYAPFAALFPRASAVVHQGGIGTTAEGLRAGRPMLVVPYGFDQPDNAARLVRLGVARRLARERYTARRAAARLEDLLSKPRYAAAAKDAGRAVRAENGVRVACDAIEGYLRRAR